MKKINLVAILALSAMVFTTSCSSDDSSGDGDGNIAQDPLEGAPISVAQLESGLSIEGGTKVPGNPPASNGELNLDLNTELNRGVRGTYVPVEYSSSDDIIGVYVQFKDPSGNASGNYYSVPIAAFTGSKENVKQSSRPRFMRTNAQANNNNEYDNEFEIEFSEEIEAGIFCYDIRPFDIDGNVGEAQEVCVTIQGYAGLEELVGTWRFEGLEPNVEEDTIGINCDNGESFRAVTEIYVSQDWELTFNQDGSFSDIEEDESKYIDEVASAEACEAVYFETVKSKLGSTGVWSYHEDSKVLSIFEYEFTDYLEPEDSEEYDEPEDFFEADPTIKLEGNQLEINAPYQGTATTYIFKRQ